MIPIFAVIVAKFPKHSMDDGRVIVVFFGGFLLMAVIVLLLYWKWQKDFNKQRNSKLDNP